jgi:hypothetical protein
MHIRKDLRTVDLAAALAAGLESSLLSVVNFSMAHSYIDVSKGVITQFPK